MPTKPKPFSLLLLFVSFSLFLFFSTLIFFIVEYQTIHDETITELRSQNSIQYNAFLIEMQYHEKLLRLLAEELKKIDIIHNPEAARPLIEKLLKVDKTLAGFGIARPDGQLLIISNIPKNQPLPNLLTFEKSKKSFLKTIQQKKMMLGDTYFMPLLQRYVLPIRIPIYQNNKLLFVMTSGIDLEAEHAWNQKNRAKEIFSGIIGRNFRTIYSSYDITLSGQMIQKNVLEHNWGLKPFSNESIRVFTTPFSFGELLATTKANLQYQFIYAVAVPLKTIYIKYFYRILPFLLIGLIFYAIFTYLFIIFYRREAKSYKQLLFHARHDMLTSLPNRHYLYEIKSLWEKEKERFAVLYMDVDNFKGVNDTYGHPFGDKLLQEIAIRLRTFCQTGDIVVRQGGDEFIFLTTRSPEELASLAQRIHQGILVPIEIDEITLHTYISIGIAQFKKDADNFDDLLRKADLALYHCKEKKRDFVFFDALFEQTSKRFFDLEEALKSPHLFEQLSVVYQPQIDSSQHTIKGFEALIRWEHPTLGKIAPDEFIPVAEKIAEIKKIGQFVRENAFASIAMLNQMFNQTFSISINASVDELLDEEYVISIKKELTKCNIHANSLCIEITESQLIRSIDDVLLPLQAIKTLGASLSLDDFGTGYSSLSLLSTLPINELKIDKSFIRNIINDRSAMMLTSSIVKIAKEFNFSTVAEGIEAVDEAKLLRTLQCDVLQGYLYSKPLNIEESMAYIKNFKV